MLLYGVDDDFAVLNRHRKHAHVPALSPSRLTKNHDSHICHERGTLDLESYMEWRNLCRRIQRLIHKAIGTQTIDKVPDHGKSQETRL